MNPPIFFDIADWHILVRVLVRLLVAMLFGAMLGFEREEHRKAAGLRTHMLVSAGAALFVIAPLEAGASIEHMTRVVQGLTTAIGFLGGGTILKLQQQKLIRGLTTAANLWVAAGVGTAVGLGAFWPALLATVAALIVLMVIRRWELEGPGHEPADGPSDSGQ